MATLAWSSSSNKGNKEIDAQSVELPAEWMEQLDDLLWKEELVNLRLGAGVGKRKDAKVLGTRIAEALGAHVAQSLGHTILLYRPGIPPTLDLEMLVNQADTS